MPDEVLCIDTNVMIWGILQNGKDDDAKRMIEKASAFFKEGFNAGKTFAISVITLSEFMVAIPPEKRDFYLDMISRNFVIIPYSEDAALKCADIFRENYMEIKSAYKGLRAIIRQDIQILASAIVFGNVKIITEDKPLRQLASKYISVSELPAPAPEQAMLFEDNQI